MLSKLQSVHLCCLVLTIANPYSLVFLSILLRGFKEFKMQQPDQYLENPDLSTSHQNLHWLPVNRRTLHKVAALCHSSLSGSGPQYLSDLTHVYTPTRSLRSSSDTRTLSTPNVKLKSQVSVLLPTTVPLHGILCHSHSDINRNLIASSEL